MKNTLALVGLILLLLLALSPISKANVIVSPAEISLTMIDTYIEGNTSKKITVKNHYYHNISVSAWMMHPDITEWMRPNRTFIENLSWITIEPPQLIISSNSNAYLYIYFNIPNETKNQTYDKHWEIWAALKINDASENSSSSLKEGYLVRIYVDTPMQPTTEQDGALSLQEQLMYSTLIAVIIALVLTIIIYLYRGKKKNQEE